MSLMRVNRTQQYMGSSELDTVIDRLFGGQAGGVTRYGVDVRENVDQVIVEAELPGFSKDEIDVTVEDRVLTITAEKKTQAAEGAQPEQYLLRERRQVNFKRAFRLPDTVAEQAVDAKLADGVLTVKLTKRPETKPRKIQVT